LISKSIQTNINKNGSFIFSSFAHGRIKRILPPLAFSLLLVLGLSFLAPYVFESTSTHLAHPDAWLRNRQIDFNVQQVLSAITFTNGFVPISTPFNTPLWSLPFEVWFYVLAGLLMTKRVAYIFAAAGIFMLMSLIRFEFLQYAIVWFFGFVTGYLKPRDSLFIKIYSATFLGMLLLASFAGDNFLQATGKIETYNVYFGIFFCCACYLFIICADLRFSFIRKAAAFSYSLYIVHFPVMVFFIGSYESKVLGSLKNAASTGAAAVAVSLLIAIASSKLTENKKMLDKYL